ncbi:hypothetical protein MUS1_00975 [Marinomonas ushuaiensis DSM 15871]|uniref:DUF2798 domain-containing protein n=1 Tax=Marinomonas ushuaiensis DSM 15871 TaxID=1122207 RepID=X7E7Z9_9GAMM|nr:DUF2798 domain-containing protein [Marinomonas ushuaiensis]ETX12209.1 hypothetical protein MUS1_00975 [Marinomonas ushuaiensis DSM 15871]
MKFRLYLAVLMSGIMSLLMSGWITFINVGITSNFLTLWAAAWCLAWPVAGLVAFTFGPSAQKLSAWLAKKS